IEVILNNQKRSFKAKIIGRDPSTDLALLKIESKNLPKINFGNSETLLVGDWVLAVGNPFNLTSTVTAGIVSAKGRNINIVNNSFPIESFIQTDAAINPGNSGGALVDLSGNLIGINTAIASNTGSYNGYGFAIPSNMVAKIVKDLIEHGEVQRGYTGMTLKDINSELADKISLAGNAGVYVQQVMEEGPADQAGIKNADVIVKVDGKVMESLANFDEQVSLHRPGDILKITYVRKGKTEEVSLKLINKEGNTAIVKKYTYQSALLGAELTPVSKTEKDQFGIEHGIKVTGIKAGKLRSMGFQEGSIITKFNNKTYDKPDELEKAINEAKGSISIEGVNPQGGRFNYNFFGY
ncbi:MAG: trypsin-like peptidase domain-containing protein, partial [Bacteroidetes bacterium]|nr:trypsin-like peptidase domain-containing protein [Bacteroidota bacterium]